MTHPETFFSPSFHNAAAVWLPILLDATVKGTLLLILAGLAVRFMRRASAASRHLVWVLALASFPTLVILSSITDGWHVLPDRRGKWKRPQARTRLRHPPWWQSRPPLRRRPSTVLLPLGAVAGSSPPGRRGFWGSGFSACFSGYVTWQGAWRAWRGFDRERIDLPPGLGSGGLGNWQPRWACGAN